MKKMKRIEAQMKGFVFQYRRAAKALHDHGIYIRTRSYLRPADGGNAGAWDVYILNNEGSVECLMYNTNPHRAKIALTAYMDGTYSQVDSSIWQNYITNGYNTRQGLFRSNKNLERIKEIEKSHVDYMGRETGSLLDHENRVAMRRNK